MSLWSVLMNPTPRVLVWELIVIGLAGASALTAIAARLRSPLGSPLIRQKVRGWWLIATFVFVTAVLNNAFSFVVLAFLSFLALKEYFTLIPTVHADRGTLFGAYLCLPIHFYWIYTEWFAMFCIFIPVYAFLLLQVRTVLAGETRNFVARCAQVHLGLLLFVYCLSHAAHLLTLRAQNDPTIGLSLFLYLLLVTALGDIAGFVVGKAVGRRHVVPRVSPGKTMEGFAGAVVIGAVAGGALKFLTPLTLPEALFAGALIAVAGILGDLCVSAIKRDVGVKDSSQFIPGHGGVLDRVDSLCFSAPLFFHFVRYFHF